MNRSIATALAVAAAAVASNGFADDITLETTPFTSTKTRAEVQAELKKPGPNYWSTQYNMFRDLKRDTNSGDVRNEYIASRREVSALTGEDSGSVYLNGQHGTPGTTTMGGPPAR
jgi:hypothetical protein